MIKLNNISITFKRPILNNFSYTFEDGKKYLISNPSGSGKTTLLKIISGLAKPNSGTKESNSRISYLFQEDRLLEDFTVLENLQFVLKDNNTNKINTLLSKLFEEDIRNIKVSKLSGGEKRRLAIIRCLLIDYDALLLDEPFNGLDENNIDKVLSIIEEDAKNKTIICVSHNTDKFKDYIMVNL